MSEEIRCNCGLLIKENQIQNHFKDCSILYNYYIDLDFKINQLIKTYINSKDSLIIVRFLFKKVMQIFDDKLKDYNEIKDSSKGIITPNQLKVKTKEFELFDFSNTNIIDYNSPYENENKNNNYKNYVIEHIPVFYPEIKAKFKYLFYFFDVNCKMNEKISDLVERYKNNKFCPLLLQNAIVYPTYNGQKFDVDQTLEEIKYEVGDRIILNHLRNIDEKKAEENKKFLEKFIKLKTGHVPEYLNVNLPAFKIDENHYHEFVSNQSIFPWKCTICQTEFKEKEIRYYCTFCDINICECCHSKLS